MAGFTKTFQPKEKLREQMAWVDDFSGINIKLLGVAEILGALGLVLPQITGILPWLTPVAAIGLTCIMIGATVGHASRSENPNRNVSLILSLFCAFIVYGRFILIPS